jgi:uncharacterized membrane protein YgdD (TMEM256/DUF423 family)
MVEMPFEGRPVRLLGGRRRRTAVMRRAAVLGVAAIATIATVVWPAVPVGAAASSSWGIVAASVGDATSSANNLLLGSACANAFECWSVGATLGNSGPPTPLVEEWDGSAWSVVPTPTPEGAGGAVFFAVTCVSGSDCWAVGGVTGPSGGSSTGSAVEEWDGSSWNVVPSPTPTGAVGAFLEGVSCTSSSDCWAVGFSTDQNGGALNSLIEQWNGSQWSIVTAPSSGQTYDQLDAISCVAASDCWAVGAAGAVQQNPNFLPIWPAAIGDQGLIEHWDGTAWSVVPGFEAVSPEGVYLTGVTCVTASDCWASGSTTGSTGTADATLMQHWDGSTWSVVPSAVPPVGTGSILNGVSCLSAQQCWAVGSAGPFGGGGGSQFQPSSFIEQWDGSAWSIDPTPSVTAISLLGSVTCLQATECWAVGASLVGSLGTFQPLVEQMVFPPSSQSLYLTAADGGIFTLGQARFHGSMGATHLNQPVVGMAATPDGGGYWEVAADGGIFSFGDARFHGSMGATHLNQPVVGMAATPDGGGYWEVAADGGIFSFGDARFHGSMGATHLNRPITGMAETPNGEGYWLVAADGGVFTFGNAGYLGSVPGQGITAASPVIGVAASPGGRGYWLAAASGSVYSYGDASYFPSLASRGLNAPVTGVASP